MADFSPNYGDRKFIPEYEQYASTINKQVSVDPYNNGKNSLRDIILCDANQPTESIPLKPGAVLNFRLPPTHNYEISESYLSYTVKITVPVKDVPLPYWELQNNTVKAETTTSDSNDVKKESKLFYNVISQRNNINLVDYFPLNAAAILLESQVRFTSGCVNVHHDISDYAAILNNLQSEEYMNLHPQTYFKCKNRLDASIPFIMRNTAANPEALKENNFAAKDNPYVYYIDCQIPLNMINPVFAVDSNYWPANLVSVNEHIFLELKTRPVSDWKDIFINPGAKLSNLMGELSKDNLNIFAAIFKSENIKVDIIDAKMNVLYKDNDALTTKLRNELVESKTSHKLTLLDSRFENITVQPTDYISRLLNNKYDSVSRIGTSLRVDNTAKCPYLLTIEEQKNIQIFSGFLDIYPADTFGKAGWLSSTSAIKNIFLSFDKFNLYRDGGKTARLYAQDLETATDFYMETLRALNFNGTSQSGSGSLNLKNYLATNNFIICSLDAFGSSNFAEIPFDGLDMSHGNLANIETKLCVTSKTASTKNKVVFNSALYGSPRLELSIITIFDAVLEFKPGNLKYDTSLR